MGPGGSATLWPPEDGLRPLLLVIGHRVLGKSPDPDGQNTSSNCLSFVVFSFLVPRGPFAPPVPSIIQQPVSNNQAPSALQPLSGIHMEVMKGFSCLSDAFDFLARSWLGSSPVLPRKGRYPTPSSRKRRNQAIRMISTARLRLLPDFDLRPINVVVSHDPSGKTHLRIGLALRCFQRLSSPHLATRPCR